MLAAAGVLALLSTLGAAAWMRGVRDAPGLPNRATLPIASLELALGAGILALVTTSRARCWGTWARGRC